MKVHEPGIPALKTAHLTTLTLRVDYAGIMNIGVTPQGGRRIAPISGGVFAGAKLRGVILPGGADWVIVRPDENFSIDVRMTLKTDDNALVYLSYQGFFRASPEAHARLRKREILREDEYTLRTMVKFETGVSSYRWTNDVLAIGVGRQNAAGAVYDIFEIL